MRKQILVSVIASFAVANLLTVAGNQEHFTSAEELGIWPEKVEQLARDIDSLIKVYENRLEDIKLIKKSLELSWGVKVNEYGNKSDNINTTKQQNSKHRKIMLNPVNAFVIINRIRRVIIDLEWTLNDQKVRYKEDGQGLVLSVLKDDIFDLEDRHPLREDHRGAGLALLRLQAFYDLNISSLIEGQLGLSEHLVSSVRMNPIDCFELGRLAYEDGQQAMAILWMYAALNKAFEKRDSTANNGLADQTINEILDYMAIAAYEIGSSEYAAKLTEAWLERDPYNERARENLLIYQEEIAAKSHTEDVEINQVLGELDVAEDTSCSDTHASKQHLSKLYRQVEIDNYQVGDDAVVKRLCLESGHTAATNNKCELSRAPMHNGHFYPGLRMEILSESPRIVRIHDIISRKEAMYLRRLAKPNLERSTIMSSRGLQASNFRIAKTAWLRGDQDSVVARIERRLSSLLNLGMEQSELLQVVNYGLGGFYGPHMDSARATSVKRNDTVLIEQLDRSDRLATILIYLSRVDAGGSTVFPRLNMTVKSIERSAVVWFNILEDGYSDERTLHTGCPVLLGTKWIATKWPHEEANSFRRPCQVQ